MVGGLGLLAPWTNEDTDQAFERDLWRQDIDSDPSRRVYARGGLGLIHPASFQTLRLRCFDIRVPTGDLLACHYLPQHSNALLASYNSEQVADQRPIRTPGDGDLEYLTQLRIRATQRAEQQTRIVNDASRFLDKGQMILRDFSGIYSPPASDLLWDIEAEMEGLVDELVALWARDIQDLAEERPIPTLGDPELDDLTYIRSRATQRAEVYIRIVHNTSQLLEEGRMIMLEFANPYQPPAIDMLWDIEARMEVLVDALLGIWAEEMADREREQQIWAHLD
ncbi:hypothetical protein PENPOL_c002G09697 [Penicillium polonicum]|uniref:Uncharacterized protein n=1 Tax=Penicillium polonicum TaxID=60169 RepID=A0A1V6NYD4_PENPO|nr:hypothetical protein PENPOL_c002G09697 [Penicillium polonicum]